MGDLIFIGSLFCALISAYLLLLKRNSVHLFTNNILAIIFLAYSYCTIGYLLISSGWLIYFPNFYRTPAPVNFLIPPLAFLYVKSVLTNKDKWTWKDNLHFLPFIFFVINYIPLYTMSYERKMEIVKLVINNYQYNYSGNDGFFSENIQLLRPIQSVVYIILQWRLLLKFKKDNKEDAFKEYTQATITWLKNFTVAVSFTIFTFLIFVIGVIYSLYTKKNINDIVFYASIPVAISFFYLSSYLIINPNVLIGLPYIDISKTNKASIVMDTQKFNEEVGIIERYLIQEAPYFKQNYTINELSLELSIPLKSLSFIINNHFKKNFNDFINYYRVAYVVDRIKAGDFKNYTLYALASKAGFSNKTSFVNAFKKVHNCTPSQYLVENDTLI